MSPHRRVAVALLAGATILLPACTPHPGSGAPSPVLAESRFVAASAPVVPRDPASPGAARDTTRCSLASHFDGVARARERDLELVLSHAWVAITRVNDKRWDDLHVAIEASGQPETPAGTIALPTVDSAGPQLTTWQASDTLRLHLPLTPGARPRRLFFRVSYHTVGYGGRFSGCEGMTSSGALQFAAPGEER